MPSPGNLVSLVFGGMDPNQQKRARQAVEELLKHDLGPNTQIGVFRIGLQLWTVQPFTNDLALVRQAVEKAASNLDQTLAEPDVAARRHVADTLAQLATGQGRRPRRRLSRRGPRQDHPPGRPPAAPAAAGLAALPADGAWRRARPRRPGARRSSTSRAASTVPGQIDNVFKATQSEANRANVSFYAIDVGGLDTWSEGQSARERPRRRWRGRASEQAEKTSGGTTTAEIQRRRERRGQHAHELEAAAQGAEREHRRLRRPRHERLPEADGAPRRRPRRLLRDHVRARRSRRGTAPSAAPTSRCSRGGTKVQHGNGYIATPPDEAGPVLAYEMPLLEALKCRRRRRRTSRSRPARSRFGSSARGPRGRRSSRSCRSRASRSRPTRRRSSTSCTSPSSRW